VAGSNETALRREHLNWLFAPNEVVEFNLRREETDGTMETASQLLIGNNSRMDFRGITQDRDRLASLAKSKFCKIHLSDETSAREFHARCIKVCATEWPL
jgi:hypothetical protein